MWKILWKLQKLWKSSLSQPMLRLRSLTPSQFMQPNRLTGKKVTAQQGTPSCSISEYASTQPAPVTAPSRTGHAGGPRGTTKGSGPPTGTTHRGQWSVTNAFAHIKWSTGSGQIRQMGWGTLPKKNATELNGCLNIAVPLQAGWVFSDNLKTFLPPAGDS